MRTGTIEKLTVGNFNFLILTQFKKDGSPARYALVEIIERKNPLLGQVRWKDASLLNTQQRTDELYTRDNHIA